MPQVQVRNLRKSYGGVTAVQDVSFDIAAGEIFGLLGPNGAGKTSTLECIIGLRIPDGGSIEVCGLDALREPLKVKEQIGAQLQSTALQDKITPREALQLFGSFYRKASDVDQLLERFSLNEKADARFETLSGGQKQRLGLALAFVNDPQVIFLDEPTSGLDPQSRRELHQLIGQMRGEGRSLLLTTHYIEEAADLCDRIAIIDHGINIAIGTPAELIAGAQAPNRVRFRAERDAEESMLRSLPGVTDVRHEPGAAYRLHTTLPTRTIIELVRLLESQNNELSDLQMERPSLEDVFIELTGTSLRE